MPTFVFMFFTLVFVLIAGAIVKGLAEWMSNNAQPVAADEARVVVKRTDVSGHMHGNGGRHTTTTYYATFEFPDGVRREFRVAGPEFGLLAEGDIGTLTHQGTRYLGFQRGVGHAKFPLESPAEL